MILYGIEGYTLEPSPAQRYDEWITRLQDLLVPAMFLHSNLRQSKGYIENCSHCSTCSHILQKNKYLNIYLANDKVSNQQNIYLVYDKVSNQQNIYLTNNKVSNQQTIYLANDKVSNQQNIYPTNDNVSNQQTFRSWQTRISLQHTINSN